jgi:phospholipase C
MMSSTTPNRLTFMTGTVRDRQNTRSKVYTRNSEIDNCGMKFDTFPERLQKSEISWKFYQDDLSYAGGMTMEERAWLGNFGTNVLEYLITTTSDSIPDTSRRYAKKLEALSTSIKNAQTKLAERDGDSQATRELRRKLKVEMAQMYRFKADYKRSQSNLAQLPAKAQDLHRRTFITNDHDPDYHSLAAIEFRDGSTKWQVNVPKGDVLRNFHEDMRSGELRQFRGSPLPSSVEENYLYSDLR